MEDQGAIRVDPALVPDCDYDLACTVLFSSISRALANPKLRAEYEAWKIENAAKAAT